MSIKVFLEEKKGENSNGKNENPNEIYYEYDLPQNKISKVCEMLNCSIVNNIGKGGFSVVKLIHSNNIPYALKIISIYNKKFKNNIKNIELIKNEIKINKSLNHPNIVQFYNSYELNEFYLLQLEYMKLGDLKTIQKKYKKLSETLCGFIITNIIDALAYLHSNNILHRDIKSDNIMINEKLEIKLGDFSLSKKIDLNNKYKTSRSGTFPFLAPECVKKKQEISSKTIFKTDIFSLGIVMYNLLHNSHPFGYKNNMTITEYSKKIQEINPIFDMNLTSTCVNFLKGLLSKKIKKRFFIYDCIKHPWYIKLKEITKNIYEKNKDDFDKCLDEMQNFEVKDFMFENISTNTSEIYDDEKFIGKKEKRC